MNELRHHALLADDVCFDAAVAFLQSREAAALWTHPVLIERLAPVARMLGWKLGTTVGYPLGTHRATIKAIEATAAVKQQVDALAVAPYLAPVLAGDLVEVKRELMEVVRGARAARPSVEILVALDASRFDDASLDLLLRATRESGCDGLWTTHNTTRLLSRATDLPVVQAIAP